MPKPTPNNFRWFLACVIASFRVCLRFLSHRYPSFYFKQFYKWMQIELWSICEILIDSIVIWVNMDPSLVIKGVDENIKIFCSLVLLFFLSLSLCRKWLAERIYRFSGQQQIAEWRQNPTCKHRGKTLRTGCAFHQITLTSGFPGRLATPWHSMTFPWIIWGANDLGHQGMTTLQLRQSHIYWESNW